jgi:ABC-type multidrug transport system fused ATPase/permease subunit
VSFRYPGDAGSPAGRPALDHVTVRVGPGEVLAIVGPSGAGKSTIARLLVRAYDPTAGEVLVGGVDVREVALRELHDAMAVVLQETLVFDGTVRDNIAYGRPGASEHDVVAAARAADAHEFITGLPDGYDTRIGERGARLSGGQRQRVALARAMIRDAPILLLDEPTTGLDTASARRLLAPMRRLMSGRTTVVISHNLLTARDATSVLVLRRGRVAGRGSHDELLQTCPPYQQLHRLSGLADVRRPAGAAT